MVYCLICSLISRYFDFILWNANISTVIPGPRASTCIRRSRCSNRTPTMWGFPANWGWGSSDVVPTTERQTSVPNQLYVAWVSNRGTSPPSNCCDNVSNTSAQWPTSKVSMQSPPPHPKHTHFCGFVFSFPWWRWLITHSRYRLDCRLQQPSSSPLALSIIIIIWEWMILDSGNIIISDVTFCTQSQSGNFSTIIWLCVHNVSSEKQKIIPVIMIMMMNNEQEH